MEKDFEKNYFVDDLEKAIEELHLKLKETLEDSTIPDSEPIDSLDLESVYDKIMGYILTGGEFYIPIDMKAAVVDAYVDKKFNFESPGINYQIVTMQDDRDKNAVFVFTSEEKYAETEYDFEIIRYEARDFLEYIYNNSKYFYIDEVGINVGEIQWTIDMPSLKSILRVAKKVEAVSRGFTVELDYGDISCAKEDAIVNPTNNVLIGGSGVDGDIHDRAGEQLLEECRRLKGCRTGEAKITKGYDLLAANVIHTVGPIYSGKKKDEEDLYSCYINVLNLALENDILSIAFPSISTGAYGYPKEKAAKIAVKAVSEWHKANSESPMNIKFFTCSDEDFFIYEELIEENFR